MRRLLPFFALLALASWAPAMEHCALEAAGLLGSKVHCADCQPGRPCAKDDCGTVESGLYKPAINLVCAHAPMLSVLACLRCLHAAGIAAVDCAVATHRRLAEIPRDWVPSWHFVRRTSPPSRAPTPLHA